MRTEQACAAGCCAQRLDSAMVILKALPTVNRREFVTLLGGMAAASTLTGRAAIVVISYRVH
jgi:hypothetical protein